MFTVLYIMYALAQLFADFFLYYFNTCENRRFFKFFGQSILWFCLSVCLSAITYQSQFKTDLHETSPSCRRSVNWEAYWFCGQRPKVILRSNFEKSSFFIWLTWKWNSNCIVHYWIEKPTILTFQGQTSKSINFQLKNRQFISY